MAGRIKMSLMDILLAVRGVLIVTPWLASLCLVDIAVSLLLPVKFIFPDFVYNASSRLAWVVWAWVQWIFEDLNGARVTFSGDELPKRESAIVVLNHRGWADFYLTQALASRCSMLPYCRYFAKAQLRVVPLLGWGLWALGMPFVTRRWDRDQQELDRVFSGVVKRRRPTWLISFSEATRYTPEKHAASVAFCAANSRTQPGDYLLLPRTKGFVATVRALRRAPHIRAVYDLTIAYQRGSSAEGFLNPPSMLQSLVVPGLSRGSKGGSWWNGAGREPWKFHVHTRRFAMEDLPCDDDELARWLEQRWVEKGEWLAQKRREWVADA